MVRPSLGPSSFSFLHVLVVLLGKLGLQTVTRLLPAEQRRLPAPSCHLRYLGRARLVVTLLLPAGQLAVLGVVKLLTAAMH